jgi:type II secretory ATPase GspE/PulE/Tfp pilus assembly ATPase PilB-like protein/CheY-like chemotaxis protein
MDKNGLAQAFVKAGLIDKQEAEKVLEANKAAGTEALEDTLVRLKYASELEAAKAVADHLGVPFVDLSSGLDPAAMKLIPLNLAGQHAIFPVREEDGVLLLAMRNPLDVEVLELARFAAGMPVKGAMAAPGALEKAIQERYRVDENISDYVRSVSSSPGGIELVADEDAEADVKELKKRGESVPAIQLVNSILLQGVAKGASDIHIEAREKTIQVRNRVDGVLADALQAPKWLQPALTSRVKIMAGMDIAEKRIPQDGRIKIRHEGKDIDLRVSTLPTQHGEKIVIRILDSNKSAPTLGDIGFHPDIVAPLKKIIHQPQGMLLVCGPTGSGKTTTLYGLLSEIVKKKVNLVTLEDPIEYVLAGANQVQVNEKAGLTFAKSLRSVLRQDPNVVFLGEIRDGETAEIAMRASMTGHLVMSTLHTNDSIATITRLLDLKIEPYLAASSVSGILAQRLVRTICPKCREDYEPPPSTVKKVEEALGSEITFVFYHGKGCDACNGTGYKGRMGVHEFLEVSPEIREIVRSQGASEAAIRRAARKDGFRSLLDDALEKMKMGLTTVEEVERVVVFSAEAETRVCPGCGRPAEEGWKACPHCAARLDGSAAAVAAPVPPPPPAPPRPAPVGNKVLIVDDEEDVTRALAVHLLRNKFSVTVAANGREALEAVSKDRPDILLADVVMPEMDGLELVRRLRSDTGTSFMPVILFSQKAAVEDRLRGFEAGSDDYLPKPFEPEEMIQRVKAVLRRSRS